LNFAEHLQLGEKLRPLRDEGILILGSGNIVHNLRLIKWDESIEPFSWAVEFDDYVRKSLEKRNQGDLIQIQKARESAKYSVPTPEHYLPLLYCFGASLPEDPISYLHTGFEYASISMRAVQFGL
jgi:4,5-DOPA dioxygenase extradiol